MRRTREEPPLDGTRFRHVAAVSGTFDSSADLADAHCRHGSAPWNKRRHKCRVGLLCRSATRQREHIGVDQVSHRSTSRGKPSGAQRSAITVSRRSAMSLPIGPPRSASDGVGAVSFRYSLMPTTATTSLPLRATIRGRCVHASSTNQLHCCCAPWSCHAIFVSPRRNRSNLDRTATGGPGELIGYERGGLRSPRRRRAT
jgi:hypothetical protein